MDCKPRDRQTLEGQSDELAALTEASSTSTSTATSAVS